MEKITAATMHMINRRHIFNLIYQEKEISRQQIAERLKLSLPTIAQNLKSLEEANLIQRDGYFQSTGGRKADIYTCVSRARVAIGVHVTQRGFKLIAVDLYGTPIQDAHIPLPYVHTQEYYQAVGRHIDSFVDALEIPKAAVLGVGIAIIALLSKDRSTVKKSILMGEMNTAVADFARWISYPCQLFHDSESAAIAEMWFSPDLQDALYLGLNYHMNGMLIMNRKIHVGKEYTGGIVEHLSLVPGGRPCYCGKRGCFTTYCSGHVLFDDEEQSSDTFFAGLRSGDAEKEARWTEYLRWLATALGSLYAVLDCDIILGGTVGRYMNEEDTRKIQQMIRDEFLYAPEADFVSLGHHKNTDISACGAAIYLVSEFIENL